MGDELVDDGVVGEYESDGVFFECVVSIVRGDWIGDVDVFQDQSYFGHEVVFRVAFVL